MKDTNKKLGRMGLWLTTIFAIVFALVMAIFWQVTGGGGINAVWQAFKFGWPIIAIVGVLCILFYYVYKFILNRKK